MANKWAVQNGNWSDGSTWNDGVVPTADDDVWANGKTITLDQDVNVKSLRTTHSPLDIMGGTFKNNTNGRFVQADLYAGNSYVITTQSDSRSLTLNGNIYGGKPNTQYNNSAIELRAGCTMTIIGNCVGFTFLTFYSTYASVIFNGIVDCSEYPCCNYAIGGPLNINGKLIAGVYPNATTGGTLYIRVEGELKLMNSVSFATVGTTSNYHKIYGTIDMTDYEAVDFPIKGYIDMQVTELKGKTQVALPPESVVLEGYEYGDKVGTMKTVPDNVAIVNLTEQEVERVKNCATVSTVQKCFEDFKEE